ncbi:MAG: hypothetical protein OES38_09795, partial [Gammaproteobacteria bacterium]|nr:hypothetical protein [Gammaproteobacteria bacterium]
VAYSARQIGRLIVADPLYRWFLQHSGVPVEDVRQALGRFVARDIDKGITSGRFELPQTEAAMSFLFGGIVTAMMATFEVEDSASAIDDLAEMLLRGLGLAVAEAREIAHRPLGELDLEKTQ